HIWSCVRVGFASFDSSAWAATPGFSLSSEVSAGTASSCSFTTLFSSKSIQCLLSRIRRLRPAKLYFGYLPPLLRRSPPLATVGFLLGLVFGAFTIWL